MHRTFELGRLFGDLRFVIIDEVHAFIDSDRGRQVMCQLERLERFQSVPARRIGLSATLGEPDKAMAWLRGGSSLGVEKIEGPGKSELELAVKYFLLPSEDEASAERPGCAAGRHRTILHGHTPDDAAIAKDADLRQ